MKMLPFLLFIGSLLVSAHLSAQSVSDTITVKNRLGPVFLRNDKLLKPKNMLLITKPVPEAYAYMRKAKGSYDASGTIGFVAGALIGWPLGTAIAGGKPEWTMAGVGAGLLVVAIPVSSGYSRNARKAAHLFNQQQRM